MLSTLSSTAAPTLERPVRDPKAAVPRRADWGMIPSSLGEAARRKGIGGTAYDTAWVAGVPSQSDLRSSQFPTALSWLVDNQLPDGSWGSPIRYEPDRVLSTLAALASLATFGRSDREQRAVAAGTRYLWQHGDRLGLEPTEPVGFELLLPTLIRRAQLAGVGVPSNLDIYGPQRAAKLRLIPPHALYSPDVTTVHSLEFLGEQADWGRLGSAQGANGSIGNSPAATAFYASRTHEPRALAYLENCLRRNGGCSAPVLYPCDTFEMLWSAYHLFLAGVPASRLLNAGERAGLREALRGDGVSLASSFPIPDADDTAVALLLLHSLGERVDPSVLERFVSGCGHFVSYPFERHSSVGVNLHVLHALARIPGYSASSATIAGIVDYLGDRRIDGAYWLDKWHVSPIYATAHAVCALSELPIPYMKAAQPLIDGAHAWLCDLQRADGSWGWHEQSTLEETAYAALALAVLNRTSRYVGDLERRHAGVRYIEGTMRGEGGLGSQACYPPMWIDKCLYTPPLVVRSAVRAALIANLELGAMGPRIA
ncbi:MAG: halimadienyl-diphosphate synthase [Chloroflexota bacterium]|nr:halimadienyl-diphosphate synthase [Chloroflexota bacterium]